MTEDSKVLAFQVGNRIRSLRKARQYSMEALALDCGMNVVFLGQIERGESCPTLNTINRISNGLGLTLSELLDFERSDPLTGKNAVIIQHISQTVRTLPEEQAKRVSEMVDLAAQLAKD